MGGKTELFLSDFILASGLVYRRWLKGELARVVVSA